MGASKPVRLQGAFCPTRRSTRSFKHCRGSSSPTTRTTTETAESRKQIDEESATTSSCAAGGELVVSTQFGSTSMLQRKLRVGFARPGG